MDASNDADVRGEGRARAADGLWARPRIVLASASPRRRELLARAGLEFTIEPADVDETLAEFVDPRDAAVRLAERKARAVAERHRGAPVVVLGADTIVALPPGAGDRRWRLLGKPVDEADERAMLAALSGTRHAVITGVAVVRALDGASFSDAERTWVAMRVLVASEIDEYVASGEWRDKAGGYAIQETADRFVTGLEEGGFDNVVGLPVGLALGLLARAGSLPPGLADARAR
ncbi:MAG: Maf family protein [Planctomycetes bacterium]|nr:Maf family protein [Planctomycetota bacterium]